jgi:hypothetical protein
MAKSSGGTGKTNKVIGYRKNKDGQYELFDTKAYKGEKIPTGSAPSSGGGKSSKNKQGSLFNTQEYNTTRKQREGFKDNIKTTSGKSFTKKGTGKYYKPSKRNTPK